MIDDFFGRYHWYRRWRGGRWWLCEAGPEFQGVRLWVNEMPPRVIRIITVDDYGRQGS